MIRIIIGEKHWMDNSYGIVIQELTEKIQKILGDKLTGIYLHGSAVMGCFNPLKSDIDLIIVANEDIAKGTKEELMDLIIEQNAKFPDKGLEISVVLKSVCNPFVYPTPFELHFSPMHLKWYKDNPDDYIEKMNGEDKDLAAHFTVIVHRGKCLTGLPINEVFGTIAQEYYMDSIWEDVRDAESDIIENPMYLTLNLTRVLAYKNAGLVLSKKEGGEWALEYIPEQYHQVVRTALADYASELAQEYNEYSLIEYVKYMLRQIQE